MDGDESPHVGYLIFDPAIPQLRASEDEFKQTSPISSTALQRLTELGLDKLNTHPRG